MPAAPAISHDPLETFPTDARPDGWSQPEDDHVFEKLIELMTKQTVEASASSERYQLMRQKYGWLRQLMSAEEGLGRIRPLRWIEEAVPVSERSGDKDNVDEKRWVLRGMGAKRAVGSGEYEYAEFAEERDVTSNEAKNFKNPEFRKALRKRAADLLQVEG